MISLEATIDLIFSKSNFDQLGQSNNLGFDRLNTIIGLFIIGISPRKQ